MKTTLKSPLAKKIRLIASIKAPLIDGDLYGYQLGSADLGQWAPLLICSPQYKTFGEACDAADRQLKIAEKAIAKRLQKNLEQRGFYRNLVPSSHQ